MTQALGGRTNRDVVQSRLASMLSGRDARLPRRLPSMTSRTHEQAYLAGRHDLFAARACTRCPR
jgi:hypothetical protein